MTSKNPQGAGAESPSSDLDDMYSILEELRISEGRSRFTPQVGLWTGLMILLLLANSVGKELSELTAAVGTLPSSLDWVWLVVALYGAIVTGTAAVNILSVRRVGELAPRAMVIAGVAVSVVLAAVICLDYSGLLSVLLGSDAESVWPGGKPLYLLPASVLGIALSMVALVLVDARDRFDKYIGVLVPCAAVAVMTAPVLADLWGADIVRQWTSTLMIISGLAFLVSGLNLHSALSRATIHAMDRLSSKVYVVILVMVGLLSLIMIGEGEQLTPSMDSVWILPLLATSALSFVFVLVVLNSRLDRVGAMALVLASAALVFSADLLLLFFLGIPEMFSLSRTMLLYPASLVGMSLLLMSVTIMSTGTRIDKVVGLLTAAAPTLALATAVALGALASADLGYSSALLSGGSALVVFIAFAICVYVCGAKVDTYRIAQWPVVHEKLRLTMSRFKIVAKAVLKNPMGLIGVLILIFFGVIAVFGQWLAPYEVDATAIGEFDNYLPESPEHWMGTDSQGHDIFSQLLIGAQTSIIVGVTAAAIASLLGAAVGLYSGYVGGWRDEVIMRLNDIVLSIPWLVLMIIIAAMLETINLFGIILIIGLTGWSGTARLVRAQVLSLRERQFVERARAIGASDSHIIAHEIMPNAFPLVFANTILTVAISILSEATLSFLHMRPVDVVTWGTMLSYAFDSNAFVLGLQWWMVAPGLCIVFLVLGFTLLGYALDDVMNPKLRKR